MQMLEFNHQQHSRFSQWVSRILNSHPVRKHALAWLNTSQFLGIVNDNIYKWVLVFLLIEMRWKSETSIISIAGAIYVIPFLLFSSLAGALADRFSKQRLLALLKALEILFMAFAIVIFAIRSPIAGYAVLFLLGAHSAMYGPSKYGILPEIVPPERVSRANGLITAFTYLGIIIGTFLASFLTDITGHRFTLTITFCLLFAIIGFLSTFGISFTTPQDVKKKIDFLFISGIFKTLRSARAIPHLPMAISSSAFFLFIGSFAQLNIIPYAIHALNLTDVAGGYLFLSIALGIAIGAYLAGKVLKYRVDLGLACLAGIGLFIFQFLLWIFSSHVVAVVICLVLLGISGGLFVVPCDTFIQLRSPGDIRGQVIGATNFLSFVGVLISSFALYFFSDIIGLSPEARFAWMGIITLIYTLFFISRVPHMALSSFAAFFIRPLFRLRVIDFQLVETSPRPILILEHGSWTKLFLLSTVTPSLRTIISPSVKGKRFLKLFLHSLIFTADQENFKLLIYKHLNFQNEEKMLCIWTAGPAETLLVEQLFKEKSGEMPIPHLFVSFEQFPKRGIDLIFKITNTNKN